MSLFIGNISKTVNATDLEEEFSRYGRCNINYKGSFSFAEFDNDRDAEKALESLTR